MAVSVDVSLRCRGCSSSRHSGLRRCGRVSATLLPTRLHSVRYAALIFVGACSWSSRPAPCRLSRWFARSGAGMCKWEWVRRGHVQVGVGPAKATRARTAVAVHTNSDDARSQLARERMRLGRRTSSTRSWRSSALRPRMHSASIANKRAASRRPPSRRRTPRGAHFVVGSDHAIIAAAWMSCGSAAWMSCGSAAWMSCDHLCGMDVMWLCGVHGCRAPAQGVRRC